MPQSELNTGISTPRFQQIVELIRQQIDAELGAHDPLPSERTVAEHYGVSRMTARRALEAMEVEGLAYSEGRKGRFVSPRPLKYDISNVSFAAQAASSGLNLEITLVEKSTIRANRKMANRLQTGLKEKLFSYTRLFTADGHPTFLETEYIVAARFPGLFEHDLHQSTTTLFAEHYKTISSSSDIVIRMCSLQPEEASLLGLRALQTGMELEQLTLDENGAPFCFGRQIWRGEMAEFSARALRQG